VEGFAKQGGRIYWSPDGPIVSDSHDASLQTQLLLMPCLDMEQVPENRQPMCASVVNPQNPEEFFRIDSNLTVVNDVDSNPHNPESFDRDASFYLFENDFFFQFISLRSVQLEDPNAYMVVTSEGLLQFKRSAVVTEEIRNAASFAFHDYSTTRMSLSTLFIVSLCDRTIHRDIGYTPLSQYSNLFS